MVKTPPSNAGAAGDAGSISKSARFLRGGNDSPLQYSCLGNLMDRGARRATVLRVAKNWTQVKDGTPAVGGTGV